MNKSESKYFNTAIRMDEALLSLLEKKDFQFITVKEICMKAEVNRSTFYLHYETIGDLLNETIEYIFKLFKAKFEHFSTIATEQIASASADRLILISPEYLIPYLQFIKENRRIFNVAFTQPSVMQANHIFNQFSSNIFFPIMKRFGFAEGEMSYFLTFYLSGMIAVIEDWIKKGCPEEIDVMSSLLIRCVLPEGVAYDSYIKKGKAFLKE